MRIRSFLLLLLVAFAPFEASAGSKKVTLSDKTTGLSVVAPKGFKLKGSGGIYIVTNGQIYAKFLRGNSPLSASETALSYLTRVGAKISKKSGNASSIKIQAKLKGKLVTVVGRANGSSVDIVTFGRSKKKTATAKAAGWRIAAATGPFDVTPAEVIILDQIIKSRQGGLRVPLSLQIPMREFVAPDGGSRALVPALPGWNFTGGGGIVTGFNPAQGSFELGVPVIVSVPGVPGTNGPVSPPVGPDVAIVNVWPQYAKFYYGSNIQVLSIQLVPGTQGWLGQNFLSALFSARVLFNGAPWQVLMLSGCFSTGSSLGWGWYYSYIAVPEGGPAGIGAGLLDTWQSWDPSVAARQRLSDALRTLLSIRVGGGPIDPEVFQRAADAWSEYIRQ